MYPCDHVWCIDVCICIFVFIYVRINVFFEMLQRLIKLLRLTKAHTGDHLVWIVMTRFIKSVWCWRRKGKRDRTEHNVHFIIILTRLYKYSCFYLCKGICMYISLYVFILVFGNIIMYLQRYLWVYVYVYLSVNVSIYVLSYTYLCKYHCNITLINIRD